jgi:hypothetical protein
METVLVHIKDQGRIVYFEEDAASHNIGKAANVLAIGVFALFLQPWKTIQCELCGHVFGKYKNAHEMIHIVDKAIASGDAERMIAPLRTWEPPTNIPDTSIATPGTTTPERIETSSADDAIRMFDMSPDKIITPKLLNPIHRLLAKLLPHFFDAETCEKDRRKMRDRLLQRREHERHLADLKVERNARS